MQDVLEARLQLQTGEGGQGGNSRATISELSSRRINREEIAIEVAGEWDWYRRGRGIDGGIR